jgi:hypothetical protein
MRIHVLNKTLFFVLLAATAAQAQITTSNVNVRVTGKQCGELKDVYLVINGRDSEEQWVKLEPAGTCRWKTDLGAGTISTKSAQFSLRADLARSDCQKAVANETDMTANLEFFCCQPGPFRQVGVKIEPPMQVTYVRNVKPDAKARVPGIPCIEKAKFDAGQGAISSTQFSGEDVYLHFWPVSRKLPMPGLLLNGIVPEKGSRILNRDDVAQRFMVQRAQGKAAIAPTLSSNALSLDLKKLAELKFERAQIEVIK